MIEDMGIDGHGIFDADLSQDKKILSLTDGYYGFNETNLEKRLVIELANDLLAIANEMIENEVKNEA